MTTITGTIDVTQEDIDNGHPGSCSRCPIALAGKRVFTGADEVLVGDHMSALYPSQDNAGAHDWFTGSLPLVARNFVNDVDSNRPVKPFSFAITLTEDN